MDGEWMDGMFSLVSPRFSLPVSSHRRSDLSMESGEWMESGLSMERGWRVNEWNVLFCEWSTLSPGWVTLAQ